MTDNLVKRLRMRAAALRGVGGIGHDDANTDEESADRIEELEAKVKQLTHICGTYRFILQHLQPENFPNMPFIHGTLGEKDQNGMPEKLMVVPALGVDFSYIYKRTDKITGPEW